jgi:hypothetical protein
MVHHFTIKKEIEMKLNKKDRERARDIIYDVMRVETTRRLNDMLEDDKKKIRKDPKPLDFGRRIS